MLQECMQKIVEEEISFFFFINVWSQWQKTAQEEWIKNPCVLCLIHTDVLAIQMYNLTLGLYEAPAVIMLVARGSKLLAVD